ncbi:E3 ubiquitin-protein ligase RBBP6 isoform X2 [Octopus sinensis]|uniref:E3 ubiquitin-protein ligase RBBP6 isoform X2 n=1 Tax=Octopus sinensis TaxID=2607531 RepID=A0A6P7TSF4_9MOLL|nr:E3 ubiquitin-protein ligase RBBP6 isoform X2 [Octopus sinensis]
MSSVHYKFKSCLNYDTVTFDGLHISLADLKKAIIQQKKLGKSVEFDLQITNAQSNQRYVCDDDLIPKNASVIVTRVPVNEPQRSQMRTWLPRSDDYRKSPNNQDFMHDRLSQTPDLANADASENDKIEAMLAQSKFFDPLSYSKGKALSGTPPLGYVCFKCGKPGHYIYSCSLKGEPNMGDMKIKRSTGIPLSFLTVVDSPDHPGALLTHSGHFAVPTIDAMAYKMGKKERPPFLPDPTPVTTAAVVSAPSELLCPLCNELLTDAVVIPCCGNSFCDECVRNALLDSEDHECPSCHEIDVSPDKLISNILLRQAVINYHNQTGYTKVKRDQIVAQQQQQQQQPQPPPSQQQEQQQPLQQQQQQPAQLKMNQLQPSAQLPGMPQQMQKSAAQALPPAAATSAPLGTAAAAAVVAPAPAPAAAATATAAEGVPLAVPPAGAHPQHPVHTPLVAPTDSRLPSGEQGPNPLHDDKPISHRPGEPHKGMAVPVLGARLRNIRPLQLVRDMNRMPGPMRNRMADRSAVVRNPGHPHQVAPVMQHMPQVLTSAQQQTPASYIPSRASLPAATMPGPTYRMPHPPPPGVSTGPVMPPPSGFIAPPIAPYSAGPRLYQIRSVPTGPRPLTPEEFYREKQRLIEEDKSRSRSNSRSYSRSPRSLSRSPYRSRSSSRSRSRSRYRSSSPSRGGSSSSRSRSSSRGPPPASSRGRRYRSRTRSRSRSRSYTPARKYSRSRSRSRSISRSRSRSRSPLSTFYHHHHHHHRHSRSPGRSSRRSRTPPYRSRGRTRSPLAPISTRDPFYRKDWSPSYNRSLRSTAAPAGTSAANSSSHGPGKRFSPPERPFPPRFPHYTPPQRPEDYYRYDSHAYEDYYRDYFSRYAPHTTYPAPSTLPASAASSVATGYDRPYYDIRGRPVTQPIAPAAVNVVVGSNSPPNRPRKRPVSRSPLRRERPRDKGDSKPGKSAAGGEPAPAAKPTKEKAKKASKVVDEDGHHKRLERKREEKAERLAREKSSAVGLVSAKKSTSRAGDKALSKEKKKAESKRVKSEKASASKNPSVPLDMYGKQGSENLKDGGCPVNANNPGSTAATAAGATNTAAVSSVAAAKRREAAEKTVGGAASKRMQETHIDPQAVTANPKMVHLTTLADAKETAHVGDTRAVAVASSSSRAVVTAASAAASSAAKLKRKARLQQQPVELAQKGSGGGPSTEDIEKTLTSKKSRREVSATEKGLQEAEYGSKALEWSGRHESDMMLPAPELSKWERDDYEVHMEPMKPKKKPLERKPLPKSVIESAEKAITEKRLKPSMLPPRKVYVDDKDTRKPGSVQITIAGGEKSRAEPVDRRIAVGRNHRPTSREAALVSPSTFSSSAAGPSSNVASAAVAAAGSASLSSVSSQAKGHHHHHHHHQPQRQRHHHHHHQDVRIARSSDSKDGGGGSGGGGGGGGVAARVGERFERKESMVDEAKFVPDYSESSSESDDVAAPGNTDVAADPSEMTSSRRVTSGSGARRSSSSRTASAAGGSGSRVGGSSGGGGDAGVTAPVEEQEEPSGKRRSGKRSKESGGGSSGGGTSGKKNKKHKKHKKHKSKKSKHKSKKSHKQRHRSGSREKSAARLLHQPAAAAMPSSSPGVAVAAMSAGVPSASLPTAAATATTKGHSTYHHDPTHQPVDGGKVRSSIATKY